MGRDFIYIPDDAYDYLNPDNHDDDEDDDDPNDEYCPEDEAEKNS